MSKINFLRARLKFDHTVFIGLVLRYDVLRILFVVYIGVFQSKEGCEHICFVTVKSEIMETRRCL